MVRAVDLPAVLKCACGHEHPNDEVMTAAITIAARIVEAQYREGLAKKKTSKTKKTPSK